MRTDFYYDNGYFNAGALLSKGYTYNFVVGGRGTGKTYSAIKHAIENESKIMFMRRTQVQASIISKDELSPFKTVCSDMGLFYRHIKVFKNITKIIVNDNEDEIDNGIGHAVGYTGSLSGMSNVRGFDLSEVDLLIYDEFIPERHERPIKNESDAFLNAIETIGRNRELNGQKPLRVLCLANSNNISNSLFFGLQLITPVYNMVSKNRQLYTDDKRSILIHMIPDTAITKAKSQTALYKLTDGLDFSQMALENNFIYNDFGTYKTKPLQEYRTICGVGEITIYKHKSNGRYYVSQHRIQNNRNFGTGEKELERFRSLYAPLYLSWIRLDNFDFDSYISEYLFNLYITGNVC